MKTLRFALIAAIISCTMVSLASTKEDVRDETIKVVNLTFAKAMVVPGLSIAMYQQLDSDFLGHLFKYCTKEVVHNGTLYRITGTYHEWYSFFFGYWKLIQNTEITVTYND